MGGQKGVTLIEVLVGMALLAVISIASLSYFSYGLGGIGRQGNRRAALERARERLEEIMAASPTPIKPSDIDVQHTVTCANGACTFSVTAETVSVQSDLPLLPLVSTVTCRHDGAAGTPNGTCDVLEFAVKVWFTPNTNTDDNYNRVYLKTLRTP